VPPDEKTRKKEKKSVFSFFFSFFFFHIFFSHGATAKSGSVMSLMEEKRGSRLGWVRAQSRNDSTFVVVCFSLRKKKPPHHAAEFDRRSPFARDRSGLLLRTVVQPFIAIGPRCNEIGTHGATRFNRRFQHQNSNLQGRITR
jgi:hypothetical protein